MCIVANLYNGVLNLSINRMSFLSKWAILIIANRFFICLSDNAKSFLLTS